MNDIDISSIGFQTFYLSRENSTCPIITDFIRISKKLENNCLSSLVEKIVISAKYGKRMIINGFGSNYRTINQDDIVEIADYDPVKKIFLVLGKKNLYPETSMHWIVQSARNDINALIQINGAELLDSLSMDLPKTSKDNLPWSLEMAKNILSLLRNNNILEINNKSILFSGYALRELEKLFFYKLEGCQ